MYRYILIINVKLVERCVFIPFQKICAYKEIQITRMESVLNTAIYSSEPSSPAPRAHSGLLHFQSHSHLVTELAILWGSEFHRDIGLDMGGEYLKNCKAKRHTCIYDNLNSSMKQIATCSIIRWIKVSVDRSRCYMAQVSWHLISKRRRLVGVP